VKWVTQKDIKNFFSYFLSAKSRQKPLPAWRRITPMAWPRTPLGAPCFVCLRQTHFRARRRLSLPGGRLPFQTVKNRLRLRSGGTHRLQGRNSARPCLSLRGRGGEFGRRPGQSLGGSARSQALIFCSWHFDFSGIRELVAALLGWYFLAQAKKYRKESWLSLPGGRFLFQNVKNRHRLRSGGTHRLPVRNSARPCLSLRGRGGEFGRRPGQSLGGSARSQALIFCSWHFDFSGIRELVAALLGWSFLGQPTTRQRGSSRTQLKIKVKWVTQKDIKNFLSYFLSAKSRQKPLPAWRRITPMAWPRTPWGTPCFVCLRQTHFRARRRLSLPGGRLPFQTVKNRLRLRSGGTHRLQGRRSARPCLSLRGRGGEFGRRLDQSPRGSARSQALSFLVLFGSS